MESIWQPYVRSDEDNWTKITDPVARRRIQNRLSQRAKRGKFAKKAKDKLPVSPEDSGEDASSSKMQSDKSSQIVLASPKTETALTRESVAYVECFGGVVVYYPNLTCKQAVNLVIPPSLVIPDPTQDQHFMIMKNIMALRAFSSISSILQLACNHGRGFNISPFIPTPPSLSPTPKQLLIPHGQYIDMLPWSTVRENIIDMLDTIDEEKFCNDMASDEMKVWGAVPWEPMSWELSQNFVERWWFLLDANILQTTNFWRMQRGETPLVMPHLAQLKEI